MQQQRCSSALLLPADSWFHEFVSPLGASRRLYLCSGVLLALVALFGNLITLVVLSRPSLARPVNVVLSWLAACDLCTSVFYLLHASVTTVINPPCTPEYFTYARALYVIVHSQISLCAHSASLWLGCLVALVRIHALQLRPSFVLSIRRARVLCAVTVSVVLACSFPASAVLRIEERNSSQMMCKDNSTDHRFYVSSAQSADCLLLQLTFWITGILFKVVPSLLLAVCFLVLIRILRTFKERRAKLSYASLRVRGVNMNNAKHYPPRKLPASSRASLPSIFDKRFSVTGPSKKRLSIITNQHAGSHRSMYHRSRTRHDIHTIDQTLLKRMRKADRTTLILCALLMTCIVTEIPQGIIAICVALYGNSFFEVYLSVGDLMDNLSLCNAAANFFVYCTMSEQFRETLVVMLRNCQNRVRRKFHRNNNRRKRISKKSDKDPITLLPLTECQETGEFTSVGNKQLIYVHEHPDQIN